MDYFKQTVLSKIKAAADGNEVQSVIDRSIQRMKSRNVNGHLIQRFILAMDKTLDQAKSEGPPEKVLQNMEIAVGLFRKLHQE